MGLFCSKESQSEKENVEVLVIGDNEMTERDEVLGVQESQNLLNNNAFVKEVPDISQGEHLTEHGIMVPVQCEEDPKGWHAEVVYDNISYPLLFTP